MKWIKLLRAYGGHAQGEIIEVETAIGDAYIAAGYAEEHRQAEAAFLETSLAELRTQNETFQRDVQRQLAEAVRGLAAGMRPTLRVEPTEAEADKTRSFGDFVQCVGRAQKYGDPESHKRLAEVYKAPRVDEQGNVVRGHEGASGTAGGYLTTPEYSSELLKLDPEVDVFAAGVRQIGMNSETKFLPALRQTGKNAPTGGSAAHAGIVTYRKSEKAARTASQSEFDQIELKATDLIAYTESTRDLLMDAPGADSTFLGLLRQALSWKRDYEFIRANGGGAPIGYFNADCTIVVPRNTSNKVLYVDVVTMLSRLMTMCWGKAIWIANVTVFPQIAALKDDAGNSLFVSSANAGATGTPAGTLMGRPIRWSEKVPALGSKGDLSLVDPSCYLEGMRAGVEIGVSEHFLFSTDQVAYRAKVRNDGQPWLKAAYRQADGSNTQVSPFVVLKAETS